MTYANLLLVIHWAGIALALVAGAGTASASALQVIKQVLAAFRATLTGPEAGILAGAISCLVIAFGLGTAQGCPWAITIPAALCALYAPTWIYDLAAASHANLALKRAQLTTALKANK
jgi:type IV secretory pathway VirB2 component (pilin)